MKVLTWIMAVVGLAVALVLAIKTNVGYVVLVYPPYRIDFSLNFLIISLVVSFSLLYGAVRIAVHTWRLPTYVRHFRRERKRERGRRATLDAEMAFAEGRHAKAERLAVTALDIGESPLLNALLAARAAHEQRNFKARDDYLARAERHSPHDPTARLMTQAELLLDARDVQQALPLLKRLREIAPKHTGVLRLDLKAQQQSKNWDGVLASLGQLEKREAIEPVQAEQLRINAHVENLKRRAHQADDLKAYWEKIPAGDRINGKVATVAARLFLGMGGTKQAREIIEQSLDKQWDSALVELYGQCGDKDVVKQIERAEKWLPSHAKDPALLLALGRLCAGQELWGKAQSYIEASLSVESTREAHLALAQLLEKMNKADEACKHYRQSLALESTG